MLKYISVVFVLFFSIQVLQSGKIHKDLINKIDSANSISINFVDTLSNQKGFLLLNKNNKYKINFANRIIYCDGNSIFNYSPFEKQVIISLAEMHEIISLENILIDLKDFNLIKESKINSSSKGIYHQLILAKNNLKVYLNLNSSKEIVSILIVEQDQSFYWEISKVSFSNDLRTQDLEFVTPDSVEIIDLR